MLASFSPGEFFVVVCCLLCFLQLSCLSGCVGVFLLSFVFEDGGMFLLSPVFEDSVFCFDGTAVTSDGCDCVIKK